MDDDDDAMVLLSVELALALSDFFPNPTPFDCCVLAAGTDV